MSVPQRPATRGQGQAAQALYQQAGATDDPAAAARLADDAYVADAHVRAGDREIRRLRRLSCSLPDLVPS